MISTQVAHPYADALLEDGPFDLWRVQPDSVFYVGGFGVGTTWVDKDDYTEAKPDAVAHEAVGLCKTLNGDKHAQDRSTIASTLLGLDDSEVRVDGVDRSTPSTRHNSYLLTHTVSGVPTLAPREDRRHRREDITHTVH